MNKSILVTLVVAATFLIALLLGTGSAYQVAAQRNRNSFVPGEVLLKFRQTKSLTGKRQLLGRLNSSIEEDLGDLGWMRVKLAAGQTVDEALRTFRNVADIEAVQPNFYYSLAATPNDPQFPSTGMYGLSKISAPAAWDLTTGSSTVVVADIDTGMRYTHEDLAANVWTNPGEIPDNGIDDDGNGFVDDYYGYDFRYNDPDPTDENGHGTHTAGTIGAVGNNGLGVVGVNWTVKLMAIKIYSASGTDSTSAMLINAYNYVRMMKNRGVNIRVTNNSYADCPEACGYDQATKDALDALGSAGIVNVFAAGNNGRNTDTTPIYPADYTSPSIISVGSSTPTDSRSGFSNFGAASVDLAAPGSSVLSTYGSSDTAYGTLSGTSMSAPHVTGAIALLSSLDPSLSAASLKATILNTADVLPEWSGLTKTGGRLNVLAALQNRTVCSFDLGMTSMRVPTKGGFFSVNVTAPQNCDYAVKSSNYWIHVMTPDAMSGSSSITFRVTVNPTITRAGTITVAGQTFTINQSRQ